jgi:NADPH:quinone reductase-like Zn-dependent oxidoreductase
MQTMKAASRRKYGSPDQISIETQQLPIPKEDEVLIKVHATTVNRTDCANLMAKPFIMRFVLGLVNPRKIGLGTDFAGEVVATGSKTTSFKVGDKVFGFNDTGLESQAEYLTTTEVNVFTIPENITYKQAAASLEGAHYAYSIIRRSTILPGQNILINGATGAIGSALLQFVRQLDVRVSATSNTKNIDLIKSLGADNVFDYTKEDFTQADETYDHVFDAVGKSTFGDCKGLLSKKGVYISSELGPYAQNIFYALSTSSSGKHVFFPIPFSPQESIPYIIDLLAKGVYKPVIDRQYSLADVSKAYKYVLSGQKTGNVLMTLQ